MFYVVFIVVVIKSKANNIYHIITFLLMSLLTNVKILSQSKQQNIMIKIPWISLLPKVVIEYNAAWDSNK